MKEACLKLLEWITDPKSERVRLGAGFGCFAAAAVGLPLLLLIVGFAAIPHCSECGSRLNLQLPLAILAAGLFGAVVAVVTTYIRRWLGHQLGNALATIILVLAICGSAYVSLEPILRLITAV